MAPFLVARRTLSREKIGNQSAAECGNLSMRVGGPLTSRLEDVLYVAAAAAT